MPYVECPHCGLTTFSAAYVFNVEYCTRCGATLPQARAGVDVTHGPPPSHRAGREPPRKMRPGERR
jgi:DNA-directed RNA polymerase subunit RPC12/RpoP